MHTPIPGYPDYAIRDNGTIVRLRDGAIVPARTIVDVWRRGVQKTVDVAWLYALAEYAPPVAAYHQAASVALLERENADLRAQLAAAGIF